VPAAPLPAVYRRRRLTALAVAAAGIAGVAWAVTGLVGGGNALRSDSDAAGGPARVAPPELPRGGRRIFPRYRVVGFYGAPQAAELGALGIGSPDQAARRLARQARGYERKTRPVLPALELIAVLATAHGGQDGMHRRRQTDRVIRRYLRAARRHKALLVLDIQPGRADFFTEVVRLRKWLDEPDVGLALDPEWRVGPGEVPGKLIGSVSSREVNAVSAWLAQLARRKRLPEKLFLVHKFTDNMIRDAGRLKRRPGLAMAINVDGFGSRTVKVAKYQAFVRGATRFRRGLKLFYHEDSGLMKPAQVMRLWPRPDVVVYE
jgi:hypothetical protein